jgi:hypothetical protein
MASKNDLVNGAKHNPQLLERYIKLEGLTGYTMHASRKPLSELVKPGNQDKIEEVFQRDLFDFC